jgi:membrane protease YdiL (CAAX protease family)
LVATKPALAVRSACVFADAVHITAVAGDEARRTGAVDGWLANGQTHHVRGRWTGYRGNMRLNAEVPVDLRTGHAEKARNAGVTRRPFDVALSGKAAGCAVVIVLAAVNVVDTQVPHASLVLGPAAAALLLVVARWSGLSWRALGLGAGCWRRGLRWAGTEVALVAAVYSVAAVLPWTRVGFNDARYRLDLGHGLVVALIVVPLGTVVLEEVAFRGVLWGLIGRRCGMLWATAISSVLFGLWHVLSSLGLARNNAAIGHVVGTGTPGQALSVLAVVIFTGVSGVVLCELRRRSGSLLAPAGLHWATNGLGVIVSAAVRVWESR